MNIKLNWLHLKNFKGIKDFKLDAKGKNVSVFGDNAVGKTSIIDAFMWLLFDKDSNNNADTNFTIKPQDAQGQDINHLQTVVEVELLVDGKPLKLKKLREEKWVTRRGTTEPVMDGHTKLYWFNEVPVKAREYQSKVDGLVSENVFKMITDPLYFNTNLSWQDRRKILLEISGDATDEQVITSDESLSRLTEILNGRSIDDYKLVLSDRLKGLKKERDDLPPRIDELTRSLPNEEPDYSLIEQEISQQKETLQGIEFLMTNATTKANELNKKHQELYSLKGQLEEVKQRVKSELGTGKTKLLEKKVELENGKLLLQSGISTLKMQIDQSKKRLENNSRIRQRLLDEWRNLSDKRLEISAEQFIPGEMATNCPMCNQAIPEEKINSQIEELKANFEKDKKERLAMNQILIEQNMAEGKSLKAETEKSQVDLELAEKELEDKEFKLENLKISINALDDEISKPIPEPDYTQYPEYAELVGKIEQLQAELDKPVEDKSAELLQKKADIQLEIEARNRVLNVKDEVEKKKARIEELKAEEKRVSALIAELEGHKFMLERFTVAKVNLLEDSINSQFRHVKFKLFEENITNDGIKETCIALVNTNGAYVKFEDANSAGKINAGIDCINALCKFYGVMTPLWIDNRESVVKLADTDSQVISLIVSEPDKELRVEVEQ